MLQLAFLSVLLCSQYAASTPVTFSVHVQGTDDLLSLNIVRATWAEADLHCRLEGGVLASPTTIALAKAMHTAMADHKLSSSVFIGVTDLLSKGEFRSLDGASVADIPLEWAAGEPNNGGNAEQCLALTGAGALADVSCSAALPYFCLKKSADIGQCQHEVPPCNGRQGYEYEPLTGSCYKFHRVALDFRSALATCHEEGAILAIINSATESDVLGKMFRKNVELISNQFYTPVGAGATGHAFVGFREYEDRQWGTILGDTLEKAGFAQWAPGEPNRASIVGPEVCGSISRGGLLNDVSCNNPLAFICEIILS